MPAGTPHTDNASPDSAQYRQALSCFATGVTVVTAHWQGRDWGMTCNSFASVSLEPKLVLWSIRKAASSLAAFTQSDGFTVNVLSQQQSAEAQQFASGDMQARFAGVPVHRQASQRQRLTEALAWFDCQLHQVVDAGDHHIVIGRVMDYGWQDQTQGLNYWRSQFGQFSPLTA